MINDSIQCLKGNKFAFFNTSSIEFGELIYRWSPGDSSEYKIRNVKHSYSSSGNYTVRLTVYSEYGCKDSVDQFVFVNSTPAGISYDSIVTRENFDTKLSARNFDSASYVWSPFVYINNNLTKETVFNGLKPTRYTIKITDQFKCTFFDTLSVFFFKNVNILAPNAFTPNRDNLNDNFSPILLGIKDLKFFKIYNRWGVLLFSSSDPKNGWNGLYKGKVQPMDTYTWVASGIDIDGKVVSKSGNFILIK
jgi:gliding motility-associated-like protein